MIIFPGLLRIVIRVIQFNDQISRETKEIDNAVKEYMLSSKFIPTKFPISQQRPKPTFRAVCLRLNCLLLANKYFGIFIPPSGGSVWKIGEEMKESQIKNTTLDQQK